MPGAGAIHPICFGRKQTFRFNVMHAQRRTVATGHFSAIESCARRLAPRLAPVLFVPVLMHLKPLGAPERWRDDAF